MQKIFILLMLICFGLTSSSYASNFQTGLDAYSKGDYNAAHRVWYTLAAEGDARAQFWLGLMYEDGVGVEQDYGEALFWYRHSAEEGYDDAQNKMGLMYVKGEHVLQDYKEAEKLFRLSASQGSSHGQYGLGLIYENGYGVIEDKVLAYMWFNIASSKGHKKAKRKRDYIVEAMTASQIEKAQDLARQCVSNNYKGC